MESLTRRDDAPNANPLRQTAFGLLGATTRDSKREIGILAEEKSLSFDADVCAKARQDLTSPRNRISAEISWLPGLSPKRAEDYCSLLDKDLKEFFLKADSEQPLVLANLVSAGIEMLSPQAPEAIWVNLILKLATSAEDVDTTAILKTLNEDRMVAGIAEIPSVDAVDENYAERMRMFKDIVRAALNRMSTDRMLDIISRVVDADTDSGKHQAHMLIDDLLDNYGLEARPFLEKEAANIMKLVEGIRNTAPKGGAPLKTLFDKLDVVLRNWNKVARPIQVSMKARGLTHDLSHGIGFGIRSLGVELYNEHDSIEGAKRVTELLKKHFSEYPELAERVQDDSKALHEIARSKEFADLLFPLRALCTECAQEADKNPTGADAQGWKILEGAPGLLSQAEHSGVPENLLINAKDEVALAILSCAIDYGNKTSNWRACLNLLTEANRFASGAEVREKIKNNVQIVQRNVRLYTGLTPIHSAPSLYTLNGCGFTLYGNIDRDLESGSYMATYYFVILAIPIFPICRYRVIATGTNSFRFLGKGPLRSFDKWHIAISIGIILWMFLQA